jgi:hypothetical protein
LFIISMDINACSYECLQHRHVSVPGGSFDLTRWNLCTCVQQTAG